jgi:hypothetical protein
MLIFPVSVNPEATTETVAVALLDASATEVADTWNIPVLLGALYSPSGVMDPPLAPSSMLQVTAPEPSKLTVNCCEPLDPIVAAEGEIEDKLGPAEVTLNPRELENIKGPSSWK